MTAAGPQPRVLVVDDEPQIRRALRLVLHANGYAVEAVATGEAALDAAAVTRFDIIILDLVLPDLDGVEVCRQLREWSATPVIVLSVHGDEEIKILALDSGADDYVTKPFSAPELLARMRVALRRAVPAAVAEDPVIRAGEVEIDLARRRVLRQGTEVHLTPTEYGLLRFLAQQAGRVVTHGHLQRAVLGHEADDRSSVLRVHVASLRKKLETDPSAPRIVLTEPGVGYRLRSDTE